MCICKQGSKLISGGIENEEKHFSDCIIGERLFEHCSERRRPKTHRQMGATRAARGSSRGPADTKYIRSDRRDINKDAVERRGDVRELRQDRRDGASQSGTAGDRQKSGPIPAIFAGPSRR